jgi:O-antigen ligase
MQEERVSLWSDTVAALRDSSFLELALGHGIGGYAYHSPSFSSDQRLAELVFPHNFLLEWWYEIGLVGCLLLILGLGYVVISNLLSANPNNAIRRTQIVVGLTLSAVLLHGFFVLPFFYSRQILFLVTILVCFSFLVKDQGLTRVG